MEMQEGMSKTEKKKKMWNFTRFIKEKENMYLPL